jgi:hypothetical protein
VALDRDIVIACARNNISTSMENHTAIIRVASTQPTLYPTEAFTVGEFDTSGLQWVVDIDAKRHRWFNYVKCGIQVTILLLYNCLSSTNFKY